MKELNGVSIKDDGLTDETIVFDKLGDSTAKIFFDPVVYSISFIDLSCFCDELAKKTAWSVTLISNEEDFDRGCIMIECNPASQGGQLFYLETYYKEIKKLLETHSFSYATL